VQAVILPGKDERPTISGQYVRRLYASPAPELDLGTFVQSATILLSDDLGGFHFDVNGLMAEQQDDKTKVRRAHPDSGQLAPGLCRSASPQQAFSRPSASFNPPYIAVTME
jgi:hypothetical protein